MSPIISGGSGSGGSSSPGFEIGYDQVTATPVTLASTTEATGTTLISCAAHTFDGNAVLVHFFCPLLQFGTNGANTIAVSLFEGATQISRLCQMQSQSATPSMGVPIAGWLRFTPTAAAHTYTVTGFAGSVAATAPSFNQDVGGTGLRPPMFVRFTKV